MRLLCWWTLLHALSVAAGSKSKKNSSRALTCKLLNSAWRRSAHLPPPPAGYPSSPYARGPAYPRPGNATPNVLLMLGDDVGYGDLAAFGGHPYARTPNLDRLFKEGTSLRQYYVVGCTCAPSRAALMSGRHPATFEFRLGLGLAAVGTPALTEVFGAAGYAVAHFGKWHLGPERPYYAARRADDGSTHLGIHSVVSSGKELPWGGMRFLFGFGAQEYTLGDETEEGWPRGGSLRFISFRALLRCTQSRRRTPHPLRTLVPAQRSHGRGPVPFTHLTEVPVLFFYFRTKKRRGASGAATPDTLMRRDLAAGGSAARSRPGRPRSRPPRHARPTARGAAGAASAA